MPAWNVGERAGVDRGDRRKARLRRHAKNGRASWRIRKSGRAGLYAGLDELRPLLRLRPRRAARRPTRAAGSARARRRSAGRTACPASPLTSASASLHRAGGAVDARRQHRVERVGDVDDPGAERDLLAAEPVRVAGAVEALVVVADRRHRVLEEAEAVDDARALLGVALHQRPLLARQARRLEEDRVRDRELADVVEERRVAEQVELRLREAELAADRERELLHAPRVAGGVRVARVDRRREGLHRRGRALAQQPVRLLERDVLRLDRLRRLAQLLRRLLRVLQVRLLRLAHQEQRHREDGERVEADGVVRERRSRRR